MRVAIYVGDERQPARAGSGCRLEEQQNAYMLWLLLVVVVGGDVA